MESGKFLDTGLGYKAFDPITLQSVEKQLRLDRLQGLIERANIAIGELRAFENMLPNPSLVIERYAMKEAVLSSQIEGTQSTLAELIENKNKTEVNDDIREVFNYFRALNFGIENIKGDKGLPLSSRLLCESHSILMENVRGGELDKTPGEFRTSQNWIGGDKPSNAVYVPPMPAKVQKLMGDLDNYIHTGKYPNLVRVALLHYQFETIHPFQDGNGRIGRLLITLFLINNDILLSPTLYLSLYFKKKKMEYYDSLMDVRLNGSYERWIEFFLDGVIQVSKQIMATTKKIIMLEEKGKKLVTSKNEIRLLDLLLLFPIITIKEVEQHLEITNVTANNLVGRFEKKGILKQINKKQRYKKYYYKEYMDILDSEL